MNSAPYREILTKFGCIDFSQGVFIVTSMLPSANWDLVEMKITRACAVMKPDNETTLTTDAFSVRKFYS